MAFDKRYVRNFDYPLLGMALALIGVGLLNIYSATGGGHGGIFNKQLLWFSIGMVVMIPVVVIDYRVLERLAYPFYAFVFMLLVGVLTIGRVSLGARRWIDIGGFSIQPSEYAKLAIILVLAKYFQSVWRQNGYTARELIIPLLLALVPFGLIARQPDLGSAGFLVIITGCIFLIMKVERRLLVTLALIAAPIPFIAWKFALHDYQKQRVLTLLDPQSDPLGRGYHIIQSIIAVGSGGITGKGFMQGSQSQLNFLPEQHTDFIFSVLAEEWGFIGGVVTLVLLLGLVYLSLQVALQARDRFGQLLAAGISIMFFWQAFINLAMVIGLFPVVGVPLPFISYGGSALLLNMTCLGILLNISMRRFMF
jgi:rod shape determining protein RodA